MFYYKSKYHKKNKDILMQFLIEHLIHARLEGFWSISQAKWHDQKLKMTEMTMKGFLQYGFIPNSDLVVSRSKVYFGEEFFPIHFIH